MVRLKSYRWKFHQSKWRKKASSKCSTLDTSFSPLDHSKVEDFEHTLVLTCPNILAWDNRTSGYKRLLVDHIQHKISLVEPEFDPCGLWMELVSKSQSDSLLHLHSTKNYLVETANKVKAFKHTWLTSTTRWSQSCSIIKSQTVVFPDAAPPATPVSDVSRK